jgi:acyl-coenzyme A synthetase/AMP-(fatty) acid ligase
MSESRLPIIARYEPARVFVWRGARAIRCGQALADMQALAAGLKPDRPYLNLCADRYYFSVALGAIALTGGVNLLPHSGADGALTDVGTAYPEAGCIDDEIFERLLAKVNRPLEPTAVPRLAGAQPVAIVFTSGSTGVPRAHSKTWGDLTRGTALLQQRFFARETRSCGPCLHEPSPNIIATVPPQHMYGLEISILTALQAGCAVHHARPLMPWAVAAALAQVPPPRVLATTPVHLRVCLDAKTIMPPIAGVISSTADLTADLATRAEAAWHTEIQEIYGSTETGSMASRRPAIEAFWTLYDDMTLARGPRGGWQIRGPQLPAPQTLTDEVERGGARTFRLLGRSADLLKVAGKRMSLTALTRALLAIDGVEDAAVFVPDDAKGQRPAALIVAPKRDARAVAAQLARVIDPVFIPRPLLRVANLPRDALGKRPQATLVAALAQAQARLPTVRT